MLWDCSSVCVLSVPEHGNSRLTVTGCCALCILSQDACSLCCSLTAPCRCGTHWDSVCLWEQPLYDFLMDFFLLPENPSGAGTRLPTRCALSPRTCTAPLVTCCGMWMPSLSFVLTSSWSPATWCPTSIYPKPWKSTSRCWESGCLPGVLRLRSVAL